MPEPVDFGREPDGAVFQGPNLVDQPGEEVLKLKLRLPGATCPSCGLEFVSKLRVEGRLRQAMADFVLHRAKLGESDVPWRDRPWPRPVTFDDCAGLTFDDLDVPPHQLGRAAAERTDAA